MALPDTYIYFPGANGPTKMRCVDSGDGLTYALAIASASGGTSATIAGPLARRADAQSVSVALSIEDVALLSNLVTLLAAGLPAALSSGALKIAGAAADGAAVAGNPLLLGAKDGSGNVSTLNAITPAHGDALASALRVAALGRAYNGSTVDIVQNNTEAVALTSAVRSGTTSTGTLTNYNARGVIVIINVTAVPGGDNVNLQIEGLNPSSGNWYTILSGGAITSVTENAYAVYPGTTVGVAARSSMPLPRSWRIRILHSAGTSFTYSVGYQLII